jgi:hypothetical protein
MSKMSNANVAAWEANGGRDTFGPDDTDAGYVPELATFGANAELLASYRQAAEAERVHEERLTENPDDAGALRDWEISSTATERIGEQLRAAGVWK